MLPFVEHGDHGPLLIGLHWLGGSAATWTEVGELLAARGYRFTAFDLPGFGHAVDESTFSLGAMADAVTATIRELRGDSDEPWVIAGHSMGGKLAAIVARAAEDGVEGLEGLCGVIFVSPSPAGPEPMKESKREEMLDALGQATPDADENRKRARKFIGDNTGKLPLVEAVFQRSIDDVLRMNRSAFIAWLDSGSKEDWADRVGVLKVPALIMAGTEEKALGPDAQREHTLPHFSHASLVALEGGGHLAPLERPYEVAENIMEFLQMIGLAPRAMHAVPGPEFLALIESDCTSPQTRTVLEQRLVEPQISERVGFSRHELSILRRIAELVIPDAGFDVSARLQVAIAGKLNDGWRFDSLPEDVAAWRLGLSSMNAAAIHAFQVPFIALDVERQNTLLQQAYSGKLDSGFFAKIGLNNDEPQLNAQQMRDWFEDVRAELVKIYIADPRTQERIGFTGFADEKGFTQIRLGSKEHAR